MKNRKWMIVVFTLLLVGVGVGIALWGWQGGGPLARLRPTPTSTPTLTPTLTPSLTPTLSIGSTWASPVDGMVQVFVPAGEFLMGSSESDMAAQEDEFPQHLVFLDAFWIDRTEVTNAMYARCVQAGACQPPHALGSYTRELYYGDPQYADYPVVHVFWEDAQTYCLWAGRRLPTEAEWEKAGRGEDGAIFPWGDAFPDCSLANFWQTEGGPCMGDTVAVGSYPDGASPYGALDMAGNAWEWVADWYDYDYTNSARENPLGPVAGECRVIRGGSWFIDPEFIRAAGRNCSYPDSTEADFGFRCARDADP